MLRALAREAAVAYLIESSIRRAEFEPATSLYSERPLLDLSLRKAALTNHGRKSTVRRDGAQGIRAVASFGVPSAMNLGTGRRSFECSASPVRPLEPGAKSDKSKHTC